MATPTTVVITKASAVTARLEHGCGHVLARRLRAVRGNAAALGTPRGLCPRRCGGWHRQCPCCTGPRVTSVAQIAASFRHAALRVIRAIRLASDERHELRLVPLEILMRVANALSAWSRLVEAKVVQLALERRKVGVLEVVWEYLVHELRLTHLELQATLRPTDDVLVARRGEDCPQSLKKRRRLGNTGQHCAPLYFSRNPLRSACRRV